MSVEILPIGYYTVTVATPEVYTIEVVTPEVYTVTVAEPESYTITTAGTLGPPGPQGPPGDDGPNNITTSTTTNITGILKGDGTNVQEAVDGTDYNSQDLQSVLDKGNISETDIIIKNLSTDDYSVIQPTAIGTENAGSGSYSYLSYDGYLGLSNGNRESQLKNTNVNSDGVILEFPDKPTGSYTIATTADVPTSTGFEQHFLLMGG
jgi:hypothetical protein